MPSPQKRRSRLRRPRLPPEKIRLDRRSAASPPPTLIHSRATPAGEDILATSFAFCMTTSCRQFGRARTIDQRRTQSFRIAVTQLLIVHRDPEIGRDLVQL